MTTVVNAPEFWALILWVPLTEGVAVGIHTLLGARTLFVSSGTAKHGIEAVLGNGVQKRDGL